MWDGSVLTVDRKNEPEQMIENARMTLSLMVQPLSLIHICHHQGARNVIPYQPVAGVQMSFHQLFLRLRVNKKARCV